MDQLLAMHNEWEHTNPELNTETYLTIGRIYRIASFALELSEETVGEEGLNRGEYELLAALRRVGNGKSATELSKLTVSSGAAISKRIVSLQRKGLIERKVFDMDRRAVRLSLTPEGEALIDKLMPIIFAQEATWLDEFSNEEIEAFQKLTQKLLTRINPQPPFTSSRF